MRTYLRYWRDMVGYAFTGSRRYYLWLAFLLLLMGVGVAAYYAQVKVGLGVTNLSDQVSWGAYIANFTFLVGIAAAAVLLVVPTYVYGNKDVKEVVLLAELIAMCAIVMCLLFVTVDLGHPERFLHMMPLFGRLNFPRSMLAWDILVITGYLVLNLHIPGYLIYMMYLGKEPSRNLYLPFVFISIGWAISIHTVTAFLYGGFSGRPFWNTAIMAPRFLVSAFASGPALLLIVFWIINKYGGMEIKDGVFKLLRRIVSIALPVNFFLLGCELFKEFYGASAHAVSAEYLFFGVHGHGMLVPYIWTGLAMGVAAMVIFNVERLYSDERWMLGGAALCIVGVWTEKGMGLIIPGFIPTPSGDLVEYTPSAVEFLVSVGIWATGAFIFTVMSKAAIGTKTGRLRAPGAPGYQEALAPPPPKDPPPPE